jgi:hypothetical protein
MKIKFKDVFKSKILVFLTLIVSVQTAYSQDAFTSVRINIANVRLCEGTKTLSYDVYLQNVNKDTVVSVPGFLVRLAIPQSDIGGIAKKVFVTNASVELGASYAMITKNFDNWILKFENENFVKSYQAALMLSSKYPGTRVGTFNIQNENSTSFSKELSVNLMYAGDGVRTKSTCSVFIPNKIKLAINSTKAQSTSNFSGLGNYNLVADDVENEIGPTLYPNPVKDYLVVNVGNHSTQFKLYSLSGEVLMSKIINGQAKLEMSSLESGVYIAHFNGTQQKIVKK